MNDELSVTQALARLEPFVGTWRAAGQSYAAGQRADDPRASAVSWASGEVYEWLAGGYFLIHRWDAIVGDYPFKGLEVIGYDGESGSYFSHFFDNAGNRAVYDVGLDGSIWTFCEDSTRASASVSEDRATISFAWEWRNGGRDWLPLCDRVARRVER